MPPKPVGPGSRSRWQGFAWSRACLAGNRWNRSKSRSFGFMPPCRRRPLLAAKKKRARGPLFLPDGTRRSAVGGFVFGHGLHGQADAALLVHFQHLDLDDIAFL